MPRNCCFCHILFELLKMEFTFLLRKCETFVRHFPLFELSFLSDLVFHWLFECYFSLNSLFLFLPLILLLFLRCGRCDVCFHPSSAWHTEGHPACLLWCRSGFFLATSASWLRTVCVPLPAIFWGQGIYCSICFICSLKEHVEERKNSAGVLCSLCWRIPLPVALLSPGMDLGAAPGSLDPTVDGSFPWGVDYLSPEWALGQGLR